MNNWESQDADNSYSPAYKNHIVDGDLNVRRNVTIAGTLRAHGLKSHECGMFATSADLRAAYPKPATGDWAIVGPSNGYYYIYLCEQDGVWTKGPATSVSGGGGGGSSADLSALIARVTQAESRISANEQAVASAATAASAAQAAAGSAQSAAAQAAASAASAVSSASNAATQAAAAQQTANAAATAASNAATQANATATGLLQVQNTVSGKADLDNTSHVKASQMPRVMLVSIGSNPQNMNDGDIWYVNGYLYTARVSTQSVTVIRLSEPSRETIYCLVSTDTLYRWDGDKMFPVGGSGGSIHIDTNPTQNSESAVSSGGVYNELHSRDLLLNELKYSAMDYQNNGLKIGNLGVIVPGLNALKSVDLSAMPPVVLESLNLDHITTRNWSGAHLCTDKKIRKKVVRSDGDNQQVVTVTEDEVSENAIYYDKDTQQFYRWDPLQLRMCAISNSPQGGGSGTGGSNVIRLEEQEGWSDNFIDASRQQFVIPGKTFHDFIFYSSSVAVDWSDGENTVTINNNSVKIKKLNPANWEAADYKKGYYNSESDKGFYPIDINEPYAKTWIGSSFTVNDNIWQSLTSNSEPSGANVYVSYRTRHINSNKYSKWSAPVTWDNLSDDLKQKIEDTNDWGLTESIRATFLQNQTNVDSFANAAATRVFLQGVIDSAGPEDVIVFPENETFVIDFDPRGYYDGYGNIRVEYDPFTIGKMLVYKNSGAAVTANSISVNDSSIETVGGDPEYYKKVTFSGLEIDHKVNIDLNGSTIKFVPNWLPNFKVVHVGTYNIHSNGNADYDATADPSGTSIKNGTIDGALDTVMFFGVHARTYKKSNGNFVKANFPLTDYEHGHAVSASKKVFLQSIDVGNVIGDGLCISSDYSWGDHFQMAYFGWIGENGAPVQKSFGQHDGYAYGPLVSGTDLLPIQQYTEKNGKHYELLVRPYNGADVNSKVDIGPWYTDEYVTVAYYSGVAMSTSNFISMEKIQYGDMLHIPDGATHFAFCMRIDPSRQSAPSIMICSLIWAYGTEIIDCDIHDCGRDGMTLACLRNPVIRNNRITRCVQAIVDVESTGYCDNDLHFDGLFSEFEDEGFACKTGDHLMLERSKISGVYSDEPYIHINDCDLQWLTIGPYENSNVQNTFNLNISKPRRVVRDTIIRGTVDCVNTLFENCLFTGTFATHLRAGRCGEYPNTFSHCTLKVQSGDTKGLTPGIYNDCIIRSESYLMLQMYYESNGGQERNAYVFKNCKFDVDAILTKNNAANMQNSGTLLDIDSCEFNIRGHMYLFNQTLFGNARVLNANFQGTFIKRLVNSKINFAPNNSTFSEFYFTPYTNALIENNVFTPTATASNGITFIKVYLRQIAANKAYDMTIRRNLINYSGASKFVFIQTVTGNDNIQVNILDNIFVNMSGTSAAITDVVFGIGQASTYNPGPPVEDEHQDYVAASSSDVKARLLGNRAIGGTITETSGNNVIRQ